MGGRNAETRLRDGGIDANRVNPSRMLMVPVNDLWTAPKGHALHDPRSDYAVDLDLAANMQARVNEGQCPNTKAILVREEPQANGTRRLHVCDGSQRRKALKSAQAELGQDLKCLVEFFEGDDAAFLEERIRRNDHDRFTRRDSAGVLAFRVKQLLGLGRDPRTIAAVCPRGIGPAEVEALGRWSNLTAEARKRFDDGAPLGLLAAVLDAPRDEQAAALNRLLATGIRTAKGATRRSNGAKAQADPWARRMSPAQLRATAAVLETTMKGLRGLMFAQGALVAATLRLAAGEDHESLLSELPKPIADAIREARASKAKRGAK